MAQDLGYDVVSTNVSEVPTLIEALYECKFINLWTAEDHALYPQGAHWSPPVMAQHNDNYTMWANGTNASPGVERVAEVRPLRFTFSHYSILTCPIRSV